MGPSGGVGIRGAFFFFVGVLVSAVASTLMTGVIDWSVAVVVLVAVAVGVAAVALAEASYRRTATILTRMETSVEYCQESYRPDKGMPSEGRVHGRIVDILSSATREILVLTAEWVEESALRPLNAEQYVRYLRTIENVLAGAGRTGFNYVRILQDPTDDAHPDMSSLATPLAEHCQRAMHMNAREGTPNAVNVDILTIRSKGVQSFVLVDQRVLVVALDELDADGARFCAGAFIIEDRSGDVAKIWLRRFQDLRTGARRVTAPIVRSALVTPTPEAASAPRLPGTQPDAM